MEKKEKKKRVRRIIKVFRKKRCIFCDEKIEDIDYKDVSRLMKFISERGKIISSRNSGVCAPHQRKLTRAIKLARVIALLPFVRK
ncbi:MAG: 30S ribosomal protein S18 [Candidatus Omnitrophota bacterium]